MATGRNLSPRHIYRRRLEALAEKEPEEPEDQSHWAKYLTVLISGYLEQSVKEVFLELSASYETTRLEQYIDNTWPKSRSMRSSVVQEILESFDEGWRQSFDGWLSDRENYKSELNSLIQGRHDVAHGKEANTNNITLGSARRRMEIAFELIEFLENLVLPPVATPATTA